MAKKLREELSCSAHAYGMAPAELRQPGRRGPIAYGNAPIGCSVGFCDVGLRFPGLYRVRSYADATRALAHAKPNFPGLDELTFTRA